MSSETPDATPSTGLLRFRAEQQTFDIGGIAVGGCPGVVPTVLVGTIFYHGHKIVTDETRGEFQVDAAERSIRVQEDYSQRT